MIIVILLLTCSLIAFAKSYHDDNKFIKDTIHMLHENVATLTLEICNTNIELDKYNKNIADNKFDIQKMMKCINKNADASMELSNQVDINTLMISELCQACDDYKIEIKKLKKRLNNVKK